MADMAISYSLFDEDHWSVNATATAGVGGAPNFRIRWQELLVISGGHYDDLVVDGVSMGVGIAAGSAWRLYLTGRPFVTHYIGSDTAAAGVAQFRSFSPLNVALKSTIDTFLNLVATFAQNDTALLSAWGHYRKGPEEPQTIPVKVEEVHIWPPKKKVGPV